MTAQFAFDTLAFVKRLSAAGMEARQAEALAEALTARAFGELATKDDLKDLELRLTIRMGALAAATVAILGALITFS
ncbi:MAG TPA: hypothetical protein VF688_10650 [Allosphingosinicella sp.]